MSLSEPRAITEDEFDAFRAAIIRGFGDDVPDDDDRRDGARAVTDITRTRAVFDGDRIVGTSSSYEFTLSVPGGQAVPTAGLSAVTVAPTHRRRGVLSAMMAAHFDDVAGRGEPVSYLWASETAIYGRFGYGSSMDLLEVPSIDGTKVGINAPPDADGIRLIDQTEADKVLPPLYEQLRLDRPGTLSRSPEWWKHRHLEIPGPNPGGYTSRRFAVASRDGTDVGYTVYTQKSSWTDHGIPSGEVAVIDVMALDDRASASLWSYLCSVDLYPMVSHQRGLPLDHELPWLASNSRAISRRLSDGTWTRLVDVAAALEARRYRRPGRLRFSVVDSFRPVNTGGYELVVDGDGVGAVTRSSSDAERSDPGATVMDVAALGALYLGGRTARPLRSAGLVQADDAALVDIDAMFGWSPLPWCPENF